MKSFLTTTLSLCLVLSTTAQTKVTSTQLKAVNDKKAVSSVSVHDPSVVYNAEADNFYVIGSHKALAYSKDLTSFTSQNTGVGGATLYGQSQATAFASNPTHTVKVTRNGTTTEETLGSYNAGAFCATYAGIKVGDRAVTTEAQWIDGVQWAPDIVYNANMGKWCQYLSLNGDYWASVIVLLTADKPQGPYTYQGPVVFSGFDGQTRSGKSVNYKDTDLELVLGTQTSLPSRYRTSAWGNLWPNCIDPCVYFDKDGELWMSYGSWSGGIFQLKLDKETGLRDYTTTYTASTYSGTAPNRASYTGYTSDPYFGKLIAGGAYVSGEGSYIQHIGDYYYLFMSYGGFAPDGGYEMRVFRSKSPEGPYLDASGNRATYTAYMLNYGKNATTNKGMKLMGAMNGWADMTVGETAQGHNSATLDKDGNAFVVYHTKFNDGTAGHLVRVQQLYQNEKGWLVSSPFRHNGVVTTQSDIDTKQPFAADAVAGTYDLIIHNYRLDHANMAEATPVKVTLSADGKISGAYTGTWKYSEEGKSYVTLVVGGRTYYGVLTEQNMPGYKSKHAVTLSAVANGGQVIWMYKPDPMAALADAYTTLTTYFGSLNDVIQESAPALDNVTVTYTVTHPEGDDDRCFTTDGVFTPTSDGHRIRVGYRIEAGGEQGYYYQPVTTNLRVTLQNGEVAIPISYPESQTKNTTSGWWQNFSTEDYTLAKGEERNFEFVNYTSEANNWDNWCLYGASATHGASGYTEYFGVRCDNWDNTTNGNTYCTSNFDWTTFKADMNGSHVAMNVKYGTDATFTMTAVITTKAGKTYNYSFTRTLDAAPANITLFFVNEGSYITKPESTGIDTVEATETKGDGVMRNLQGMPVSSDYRGIVILNGRKFVIK